MKNRGDTKVSIIIPTYNRFDSLLKTLHTIEEQNYPLDLIEVIVVDDGSTNGEEGRILNHQWKFDLKYIRQSNQGSAVARNLGATQAQGNLFIFIDDDILLSSNYVGGLLSEHQRFSHLIGMGRLLPYLPVGVSLFGQFSAEIVANNQSTGWVEFVECLTCNLSVMAEDFYEIGGMQDVAGDGPTYWGDVDFGYRALQLGYRFLRSDQADCVHCDYGTVDFVQACRRVRKWGEGIHALEAKYPGVIFHLPMFSDILPLNWQQDGVRRGLRKLLRRASATTLATGLLKGLIGLAERGGVLWALRPLYRWTLGAYLYRGYRAGMDNDAHSA
jgi:glycosyltransferase involved in cell wall biosynthesis